jgi:hypothetical protein
MTISIIYLRIQLYISHYPHALVAHTDLVAVGTSNRHVLTTNGYQPFVGYILSILAFITSTISTISTMSTMSLVAAEEFTEESRTVFPPVPHGTDVSPTSVHAADAGNVAADARKGPEIVPVADVAADVAENVNMAKSPVFFDKPGHDNIYAVERLCLRKIVHGKSFYLVKWTGWASKHNTWEPTENLIGSDVKKMMQKWVGPAV